MRVLVTGGLGYIGSHIALRLDDLGHSVSIVDNRLDGGLLRTKGSFVVENMDVRDFESLGRFIRKNDFEVVIHCAALTSISDSLSSPDSYFDNNAAGTIALMKALRRSNVSLIVYSSTAAVYGLSEGVVLDENAEVRPSNPYGESKLQGERIIEYCARSEKRRYVIFRYFNVAGADPRLRAGPQVHGSQALVPSIIKSIRAETPFRINGCDYATLDGTCVRDLVDVCDLAEVHSVIIGNYREVPPDGQIFNLGYGTGCSVLNILRAAERTIGKSIAYEVVSRRPGDLSSVVADSKKLQASVGKLDPTGKLERMIRSTLEWSHV